MSKEQVGKDMLTAAHKVLSTITAPYGVALSADQLAAKIVSHKSVEECDALAFAFFSDVSPKLQNEFIEQMGLNKLKASNVASAFSKLAGYPLALAEQ